MMVHSVITLRKEDEDESMVSADEVDTINSYLISDIEGENHSSSKEFATSSNGIGDANTNLHQKYTLESTRMKEEQASVLGNQIQEIKRENESHLQHTSLQDYCLPVRGQFSENPSCVPQVRNLQAINNPIGNEPERLQPQYLKQHKMSTRQVHGLQHSAIYHLVRNLIARVDKDKGIQLHSLYSKFKRNEITNKGLIQQMRDILGDEMVILAARKVQLLQTRRDMPNNQSVESMGEPPKSTINMTTGPKLERLTSVNGQRDQSGSISHYQNNTSLSAQESVTKDQTLAPPFLSLVHVKHESVDQAHKPRSLVQQGVSKVPVKQNNGKPRRSNDDLEMQPSSMGLSTSTTHARFGPPSMTTQMDSNAMVKWPAPSGTTPAGLNVRTTPLMPYIGQKKPFEAPGSSFSPSRKKQKLCGTPLKQSIKQLNDVTAVSGINLSEEEEQLLLSRPKRKSHDAKAFQRVVCEEEERTVLQKIPLQRKLAEIMAKSGLKRIKNDVVPCLSLCVEERMRGLLYNVIQMSKQRNNTEKCRHRTCVTSDIQKQINEMNQKVQEEWERKHGGEEKVNKEDQDKVRAKAANVAALAAVGGNDAFLKWKLMAEARKKPSSKKLYGETSESGSTRIGNKQGLTKPVRSISVKDVIDVMEKESQKCRTTLWYRLCNRISSWDVVTQEKTSMPF